MNRNPWRYIAKGDLLTEKRDVLGLASVWYFKAMEEEGEIDLKEFREEAAKD